MKYAVQRWRYRVIIIWQFELLNPSQAGYFLESDCHELFLENEHNALQEQSSNNPPDPGWFSWSSQIGILRIGQMICQWPVCCEFGGRTAELTINHQHLHDQLTFENNALLVSNLSNRPRCHYATIHQKAIDQQRFHLHLTIQNSVLRIWNPWIYRFHHGV
jgi:hypothetical protein